MSHRINYCCSFCGYRWNNYFNAPLLVSTSICPNCDQETEASPEE